jgi:D-serine deaminase-like pyridoxal phosphate-dependent protein
MDAASLYVHPTKEELVKEFVGKSIKDVATPAAIIDLDKVKDNCSRMLEACDALGFGWRAHIKTHKVGPIMFLIFEASRSSFL